MRRWRNYLGTGNKRTASDPMKRVCLPFLSFIAEGWGVCWLHRQQPQKPSSRIKRSFRGSVSHAIPLCGKQSFSSGNGCRGVFIQTSDFIDTFGMEKTAQYLPKIWLKLFEKLVSPFRWHPPPAHTPQYPPAGSPVVGTAFQGSPKIRPVDSGTSAMWIGSIDPLF